MGVHDTERTGDRRARSPAPDDRLRPDRTSPPPGALPRLAGVTGIRLWQGPAAAGATIASGATGVVMARRPSALGDGFSVFLSYADGRPAAELAGGIAETEIVAVWRRIADDLGLPLVVERPDGTPFLPYEQIGRLKLGPFRYRRRNATLSRRRPRFLQRRAVARVPERPAVHGGPGPGA